MGLLILWIAVQGLLVYVPSDPKSRELFLHWSFLRYLPIFGCGAIAFHWLMQEGQVVDKPRDFGILLIIVAVAMWTALVNGWLPTVFSDLYYWQGIIFLCLLLGAAWAPIRLIVNRFSVYLGRISYSLYLNHPTLVLLLSPVYAWVYGHSPDLTVSFVACAIITLTLAIAVSELTYRFVEEPGIKLGKAVNRWIRGRQELSPVVDARHIG